MSERTVGRCRFYPKVNRSVLSLLSKADWSWGCVSAIDSEGRTSGIADAHRDNGKRLGADEKLSAFLELESAIRQDNGSLHQPR